MSEVELFTITNKALKDTVVFKPRLLTILMNASLTNVGFPDKQRLRYSTV